MDIRAEVIAIGDELTSGVRLDTNTQWLSHQLEQMGLRVAFQTTVGDDREDLVHAFQTATNRVPLLICTGGLGPTSDDLTREIIAAVGNRSLRLDRGVLAHIQSMFETRGREMPQNNEIQAWFPEGARVIPNPEGTAPGIEFSEEERWRVFALPGVPAEMKQMWRQTVESRLREWLGIEATTHHHTLHCFGTGESHVEMLLPEMIRRGRDPLVGITASAATISLRVSTRDRSLERCREKVEPTLREIRERLGSLVFGENGEQLEDAVVGGLNRADLTLALRDYGLHGDVARRIARASEAAPRLVRSETLGGPAPESLSEDLSELTGWASLGVVISSVDRSQALVERGESWFEVLVGDGSESQQHQFRYSGHSAWREERAVKDVLNSIRLFLESRMN